MEDKRMETKKEHLRLELDSLSQNEEFARVVTAVFMSRLNLTLEEIDDVKTAVSEAVTNAVIHGYKGRRGPFTWSRPVRRGDEPDGLRPGRGRGNSQCETGHEPMYTTDTSGERSGMGFPSWKHWRTRCRWSPSPARTLVTMKKFIGR